MTSVLIRMVAIAFGPRMLRCLLSNRKEEDLTAVLVIGHGSAWDTTSNSRTETSFPPGALLSSTTWPLTTTADSWVACFAAWYASSEERPYLADTWT